MSENMRQVTDGEINVLVKKPSKKDKDNSQIVYSKAWRNGLENGLITRAKLNEYLVDQGLWSKQKQKEYEDYLKNISEKELEIKRGGISLKAAKFIAIELRGLRSNFRDLITERTVHDNNTAEGIAENARFDFLVRTCVLDPVTKQPVFKSEADYDERGSESWAIKAASELANFIYDLDPNYEKNLPENKFLNDFKLVNNDGKLINKEGHLIAIDLDGTERLIDNENYYIAYNEDGSSYRVNRDGDKIEDIEQKPFLDDDGNPIDLNASEEPKKSKKKKSDTQE